MKKRSMVVTLALCAMMAAFGLSRGHSAEMKVNDPAPDITLPGTDGKQHTLREDVGKSWLVVAWFPKAFTPGCTCENDSLRDTVTGLQKYKVDIYAASVHDPGTNRRFAEERKYPWTILSDPDKKLATTLGVLGPMGFARRWTYFIDDKGFIRRVDHDVQPVDYGKTLSQQLADLQVPLR